ncbi:MAG TPA: Ig-like domain-containing protein [Polyangiaceae bacterium]|nr:Ig-like domain-containing protein [Polyangiaceae bacterium]
MIDSSVLWRDDRIKRESNTTAKLAVLFTVVVCVVLTVAVVMSRPRLIGMSLSSSTTEVKVGQKLELHPAAVYDPDRRAGPDLSRWCYSCDWSSSDRSVATVSYGTVAGVAAGTATITVGYEGKTDELEVTVLPWDFPGLKGNLEAVKFFAVAPSLDVPEQTARAYQATFSAGSQASIWLELTVNIGDKAPPRNLFAGISAELGGPGRDPIERFITFTAQEDWPGVVTVHQLFDKVPAPGTYALTLQHAGRDIGSAKFTVQ